MLEKIRQKLLDYINSDKDAPLLAGFSIGFYMMLFYYSKNFSLANSWQQFAFFTGYYIVMPILTLYAVHIVTNIPLLHKYKKPLLFTVIIGFFAFFLLQLLSISFSKAILFGIIVIIAALLSLKAGRYYKFIAILLLLLSLFNAQPVVIALWKDITTNDSWKKQPDAIENVVFKERPNIYYIQPDGYTNFKNLKDSIHNFNNSDYESFLRQCGFTLYPDYRSNYYSTLLSNSATFSMKHHYLTEDIDNNERDIIVGDNPVLRILRKNGYKTHFITENPYLIINRPQKGYNDYNISYSELPYIKDGFGITKDVMRDFKARMQKSKSGNFYFIEKFTPQHIAVFEADSKGPEREKAIYLKNLEKANTWLKEIVNHIETNDKNALIIIGADHGGFAGFNNTLQCAVKTDNPYLKNSVFGAHLAIKWTGSKASGYDMGLKSGVNLFRTVFAYLAGNKSLLNSLQENSSYIKLDKPDGIYRYINTNGKPVFEKKD